MSQKTIQTYSRILRQLREAFNATSIDFALDYAKVIEWIENLDRSVNTRKLYYITLVSTLKSLNRLEFAAALHAYKKKQDEYNKTVQEFYEKQEMSSTEAEKFLDWPAVLKVRETVRLAASDLYSYQQYVILCLYTMIPPLRLDFANMPVIESEEPATGNFLLARGNSYTIVLREFKTAARFGEQRIVAPPELSLVLHNWLELNQSGWLLFNADGGPMSETSLSQQVIGLFKKYTGKSTGVSTLRHSYVSFIKRDEKPLLQQKQLANSMLHSQGMSVLYRKIT